MLIGSLLKPGKLIEDSFLHRSGEIAEELYFIYNGLLGFVLPEQGNLVYAVASGGDHIGLYDLIPMSKSMTVNQDKFIWKFSVQCLTDWCEYLTLRFEDLEPIKEDYPSLFDELFVDTISMYEILCILKRKAEK